MSYNTWWSGDESGFGQVFYSDQTEKPEPREIGPGVWETPTQYGTGKWITTFLYKEAGETQEQFSGRCLKRIRDAYEANGEEMPKTVMNVIVGP